MSQSHRPRPLSIAPTVYDVAVVLAEAHGGYGPGDPENWANFTHEATLVLEALQIGLKGHLDERTAVFGPPPDQTYLLDRVFGYLSVEPSEPGIEN